jgi:UDP-3-O-[3-hydroxymyristoyl] glucosamine N-acyltransferase
VVIGARSVIGAGCYIGHETKIGEDCLFHPNVTIRERCLLGNKVYIHSGAVIGSDGFGYIPGENGHTKIPQVGIVQIDDDVELGANVTVDRARFGRTWIKEGVKVDNIVHIAHNVIVGKYCFIVSQVGIAGSTELEDRVVAAGQVGIGGHLHIGAGAMLMGQSGVTKDIEPGATVIGSPAIPIKEQSLNNLYMKKLRKFEKRLKALENS